MILKRFVKLVFLTTGMFKKIIFGFSLAGVFNVCVYAGTFSTWKGTELDKCASIWLIKRFIDKNAQIKFYSSDTFKMDGIAFDVPTSDLRSKEGKSTFTHLLERYKIDNAELNIFKKIIQDIEVNIFGEKFTKEAEGLNAIINGIISSSKDEKEIMEKSFVVFDGLYADISAKINRR